jgi:RHS repeat-associated protein
MTLSTTTATAGDVVTVTANNVPAGTGYWLALTRSGAPSNKYNAWVAVNPTNGNFVWNVAMPAFPGTYEVRLFQSPFKLIGSVGSIAVSAPAPSPQAVLGAEWSVTPAGTVTVRLANGFGGGSDWMAFAVAGSPATSYLEWTWVGSGVTTRTWTTTVSAANGNYEFRLYRNNSNTVAASTTVRLTSDAPLPVGTGGGPAGQRPYDFNGNRRFDDGSTYTTAATSNRLLSVSGAVNRTYSYDLAGNVTSDGTRTFTYDDAGRLASVSAGASTSYVYNALGQRVKKLTGGTALYFVYDEGGHLLGEYTGAGALVQETVWLGDTPVATLRPNGAGGVNVYYVHTDHLNTPRRVSRPADNVVVWRWNSDAFGATPAESDPDGDGISFAYGLRFPGQYLDQESGVHYNYMRDLDPATGRYIESDPIGLAGGLNTYAYVKDNPISLSDPTGLVVQQCCRKAEIAGGVVDHCWLQTNTITAGMASSPQCRANVGARSELPWKTKVYVSDHSCEVGGRCNVMPDIDEDCVNRELAIGKSLGRFGLLNNCQTFVFSVAKKCSKRPTPIQPGPGEIR